VSIEADGVRNPEDLSERFVRVVHRGAGDMDSVVHASQAFDDRGPVISTKAMFFASVLRKNAAQSAASACVRASGSWVTTGSRGHLGR
jgi:hypothetical protein